MLTTSQLSFNKIWQAPHSLHDAQAAAEAADAETALQLEAARVQQLQEQSATAAATLQQGEHCFSPFSDLTGKLTRCSQRGLSWERLCEDDLMSVHLQWILQRCSSVWSGSSVLLRRRRRRPCKLSQQLRRQSKPPQPTRNSSGQSRGMPCCSGHVNQPCVKMIRHCALQQTGLEGCQHLAAADSSLVV